MDAFEIGRLTDFDFELLCKDLFEEILNVRLEIFARGPDGGIDLRYEATPESSELIIQCKHWVRSSASTFISHIRNKELPKVLSIRPQRYILATSVALSRSNKDDLAKLLFPYVRGPGDIYGIDEVVSELRARPNIVQRHLRLWLSGTSILQGILNKSVLTRSAHIFHEATESATTYVVNDTLSEARSILEDRHVCLISGIPGIGKTTLANILLTLYAEQGYSVYDVSRSVDDVYRLWGEDQRQLFYFDDFLGQTALQEKFARNEDARLIDVLELISRSPEKLLILTTREYLLEQARLHYERLARQDFSLWNCVLSMDSYSKAVRAEILYNHLYFSKLTPSHKRIFADTGVYERIIGHDNFNPRLIQQSIALSVALGDEPGAVAPRMLAALDNPENLWDHIVNNQIEPTCTNLLSVLLTLDQPVLLQDLEAALIPFVNARGETFDDRMLKRAIKILQGTMIKPVRSGDQSLIEYHNPSIRDYMKRYIKGDRGTVKALLTSAVHFEQAKNIYMLSDSGDHTDFLWPFQEELIDACIRTFSSPSSVFFGLVQDFLEEEDVIYRAVFALEIALDYRSPVLAEYVAHRVNETELALSQWDDQNIASIRDYLNTAVTCAFSDAVPGSISKMAQSIDAWMFEIAADWDGAVRANRWANEIDVISERTLERIDSTLEETARRWLEDIAKDRDTLSEFELIDLFQHVERFPNPGERFEHYRAAREKIDSHGILDVSDEQDPITSRDSGNERIHVMFQSLRNLKDS